MLAGFVATSFHWKQFVMLDVFLDNLLHFFYDVWPALALGFLLSGIIHEFIPESWIDKYLSKKGFKPIFYATIAGMILPICCMGSLPVAISFHKKGAPLGPVLAFLVATPATSLTAIILTVNSMGVIFTLYLCAVVILIGVVLGFIGNHIHFNWNNNNSNGDKTCTESCCDDHAHGHKHGLKHRIISALRFGFVDMLRDIGLELILGLVLAAAVASVPQVGEWIRTYLSGAWGYVFAIGFGLVMYICSTASVPFVHAMMVKGMNAGAGMVLLVVGPITSYGTILVIRKKFGGKVLAIYLAVICVLSVILGYLYSILHTYYPAS